MGRLHYIRSIMMMELWKAKCGIILDCYGTMNFGIAGFMEDAKHGNGQLGANELWKNGCWDGKQQSWHDNGSPQMFVFSRNGESHGEWKEWSEHGRLIIHEFYRNGQCIDPNFTVSKKCKFGKLKRKFRSKKYHSLMNTFLISDFAKFSV